VCIAKAAPENAKEKREAVLKLLTDLQEDILATKALLNNTSGMSVIARGLAPCGHRHYMASNPLTSS
jgi:hypothetical protein